MPSNDATGLASGRSNAEVSNGSSPIPIELWNFAALLLVIAGSAWALWYYADLRIDQIKAFAAMNIESVRHQSSLNSSASEPYFATKASFAAT
jgi:hypothetical protein